MHIKKSASASKTLRFPIFLFLIFCLPTAYAATGPGGSAGARIKQSLKRGGLNMLTAPLEIPLAVQEAHEKAGYPLLRHGVGSFGGVLRTVHRFGSGFWDFVSVLLPGRQKAIPIKPAVLL